MNIKILFITLITLLLSSCGFHLRQASDIPLQLHTLYLDTDRPYNPLVTQLKAMLNSLNIHLVKNRNEALYTLKISNITFTESNPPIVTTSLPITFTYTLSAAVQIENNRDKNIVSPKTLSSTQSISQNASQVYTPTTATVVKQELRRDITSQIYYLLISNNTRKAVQNAYKPT